MKLAAVALIVLVSLFAAAVVVARATPRLPAQGVDAMTPLEKAQLLVVTTVRPGVFSSTGGITFADQEGGLVKALPTAAPFQAPSLFTTTSSAFLAGRAAAGGLRAAGVDIDFAPVFDTPDGPLGSRQFQRSELAVAFARGLGPAACAKHFPGLGSAPITTDARPHVDAQIRSQDLAPYRAAIRGGLRCVMVSNAFYDGSRRRASLDPSIYRLLRTLGFRGIAITDSLSVSRTPVDQLAPRAVRAGADLLLFTSTWQAAGAVQALVPLARAGELDDHVARVLRLHRALG